MQLRKKRLAKTRRQISLRIRSYRSRHNYSHWWRPKSRKHLIESPNAIQLTPKPLTQPVWITAESDESVVSESNQVPVDPAIFDAPLKAANMAAQAIALSPARDDESADRSTASFVNPLATPIAKSDVSPAIIS